VRSKQREGARLRAGLTTERATLARLDVRDAYHRDDAQDSAWAKFLAASAIQRLESSLAQTLKAPPLLRQPLPSDRTLGPRAIFYTHMPRPLARLARWSFECYEVLLDETRAPRHVGGAGELAKRFEASCATDLSGKEDCLSYHDRHNPNRKATRGVSLLECWDVQLPVDNAIAYSKSVDTISSPADGVYHPQSYAPLLVWRGCHAGGTTGASPFAVKRGALVEAFCDLLPEKRLQWAMHQPGEASKQSTRGNDGPALQDQRPTWLGRLSFLALCGLRSWPNRQLRAIAAGLHDGLLPLEYASTHALLIHALCHVGELRDDGGFGGGGGSRVRMAWKGDVLEGGGAELSVLAEELESAVETLSEQPRAHSTVLVLGRIASFLGGLCSEPTLFESGALDEASARRCLRCAHSFSSMAARWADDLEEQLAVADRDIDAGRADALRAQEHVYLETALACFGTTGVLDAADAATMCALRVRTQATAPLLGNTAQTEPAEYVRCSALAQMVMAARVCEVTPLLHGAALTAAAACVLHERLLTGAKWSAEFTSHDHAISCFNAVTADGTLLSLNVLNGIVLCNGKPPNRLPESIIAHPLYARTFGARNCMVVPEAKREGALTTARPLAGRSYTFLLTPGGALVVHELQPAQDGLPTCIYRLLQQHDAEWAEQLPVRLKEMHSHWLSEDFAAGASGSAALGAMEHADCEAIDETAAEQAAAGRVVVLRPVSFESRKSSFVAIVARRATGGGDCAVYRVQESMGDAHPGWLLSHAAGTPDHLITFAEGSCGATCLNILAKLEEPRFIEAYVSPDGRTLKLRLQTHALHFELREGAFHSVEHSGHELAPCQ
jgi:hypothetical protein